MYSTYSPALDIWNAFKFTEQYFFNELGLWNSRFLGDCKDSEM